MSKKHQLSFHKTCFAVDLKKTHKMTTHWEDNLGNFERDMAVRYVGPCIKYLSGLTQSFTLQWGQGIQMLEDKELSEREGVSVPLKVSKGEELIVNVQFAEGVRNLTPPESY